MNLSEAKVLVTGGSSGIGAATARHLRREGAAVAIAARRADRLRTLAEEIGATPLVADVAQEADVRRMTEQAHQALGGLNVLINNAGYGYAAPLLDLDAEAFRRVFETNVLGAALCAREAAKLFVEQSYGHIVNIASTAALNGVPQASPYVGTKFALRGMTQSWRNELRPHNIRVMLVNPSEVMTEFASSRKSPSGSAEKAYSEREQDTKLRADEIAELIVNVLRLDDRGFVPEVTLFATNPQT